VKPQNEVVFLFDVDNTLLDDDRVVNDLTLKFHKISIFSLDLL
jgi:hypothetical protein